MYNMQKLLNKLMSRNFFEFVQAEKFRKTQPIKKTEELKDDYAEAQAKKANGLFGLS